MSHAPKIEALMNVASRLIAVLERELEHLRAMRPAEVAALQDEKAQLVVVYEELVRDLSADPDTLSAIAPALRDEFSAIAERFDRVVTANRQAVDAAREAQKRLLDAIVRAAEEQRNGLRNYSPAGARPAPAARRAGAPVSLTFDRRL